VHSPRFFRDSSSSALLKTEPDWLKSVPNESMTMMVIVIVYNNVAVAVVAVVVVVVVH
jgi:hypothetical protein